MSNLKKRKILSFILFAFSAFHIELKACNRHIVHKKKTHANSVNLPCKYKTKIAFKNLD